MSLWDAVEIIPGLFLGAFTAATNTQALSNAGITHILNVASDIGPIETDRVYRHIPIKDGNTDEDTETYFPEAFRFLNEALRVGKVLVHCRYGVNRSATIVLGYLIELNYTLKTAFRLVLSKRPSVQPFKQNRETLVRYEVICQGISTCSIDELVLRVVIPASQSKPAPARSSPLSKTFTISREGTVIDSF